MFVVTTTVDGVFLSTPSARRATLAIIDAYEDYCSISIHALREEGDLPAVLPAAVLSISIHALREEGDTRRRKHSDRRTRFLSTPSARRATMGTFRSRCCSVYFYPRPPRGGRRKQFSKRSYTSPISIHALREEGDSRGQQARGVTKVFLSTPSARRATGRWRGQGQVGAISIHALREEGDGSASCTPKSPRDFYPRPPRGGRLAGFFADLLAVRISIHALREEGDHRQGGQ